MERYSKAARLTGRELKVLERFTDNLIRVRRLPPPIVSHIFEYVGSIRLNPRATELSHSYDIRFPTRVALWNDEHKTLLWVV